MKNAQYMIDQATYDKEVRRNPGFGYGWSGSLTAGATLVEATQNSRNFTGSAALVANHSYGELARPAQPHALRLYRSLRHR